MAGFDSLFLFIRGIDSIKVNTGLTNVLLRLLLNFGQECSMELYANELSGTTVHLIISHKTLWNQKPTDT